MSRALQANLLGLGGATVADRYVLIGPIACTRDLAIFRGSEQRSERELFFEIAVARASASEPPRSEALSQIGHPSIAVAIESGRIDPDFAYAVMEPIAGKSLLSLLTGASKGRLEPARAVRIGIAIAELLDLVHAAGGVYGQLHPARVFVDGDDEHPRIVLSPGVTVPSVIDLQADEAVRALAEARPELAWDRVPKTLGAPPAYAAPELFSGHPETARSDVYSLGALLYELSCGKRPYSSTVATRIAAAQLMRTPIEIDASLPEPLAAVLAQALRHDPSERFASMHELAAALTALAQQSPEPEPEPERREALSTRDTLVLAPEEVRAMQSLSRPSSRPDPILASPRDPTKQHHLSELVPTGPAPAAAAELAPDHEPDPQSDPEPEPETIIEAPQRRSPFRAIAATLIATALALLIVWRVTTPSDAPTAHTPSAVRLSPRDTARAAPVTPASEPPATQIEASVEEHAVPAATTAEIPRRRPARSAARPKPPRRNAPASGPYKIDDLKRPAR